MTEQDKKLLEEYERITERNVISITIDEEKHRELQIVSLVEFHTGICKKNIQSQIKVRCL